MLKQHTFLVIYTGLDTDGITPERQEQRRQYILDRLSGYLIPGLEENPVHVEVRFLDAEKHMTTQRIARLRGQAAVAAGSGRHATPAAFTLTPDEVMDMLDAYVKVMHERQWLQPCSLKEEDHG